MQPWYRLPYNCTCVFLWEISNQKYRLLENTTTCVMPSTTFMVNSLVPGHFILLSPTSLSSHGWWVVVNCVGLNGWLLWWSVFPPCWFFDWGLEVLLLCRYCTYTYRTLGLKCCSTELTVNRTYTYRTPGTVKCCSTEATVYCTYTYRSPGAVKCRNTETTVYCMYTYRTPGAVKCCSLETTGSQYKYWPTLHSTTYDWHQVAKGSTRIVFLIALYTSNAGVPVHSTTTLSRHLYTPGSSDSNVQQ